MENEQLKVGFYTRGQKILHIIITLAIAIVVETSPYLVSDLLNLSFLRIYKMLTFAAIVLTAVTYTILLLTKRGYNHSYFIASFWLLLFAVYMLIFFSVAITVAIATL